MKKLFPILAALALLATACQMGGAAQPTASALPDRGASPTPGPQGGTQSDAAAGETRTAAADGMVEVFIPAGTFTMGGVDPLASTDEQPFHQVTLDAYWIDKVEVTNGMYSLCVKAGACRLPMDLKSQNKSAYYSDTQYADYPVVYVTWLQAKTYC